MSTARTAFILTSLLSCLVISYVQCAMLWVEEPPPFDDPCTIVVISSGKGERDSIHPLAKCLKGGVIWLGTFGRVTVWLNFGTDKNKIQEFELCLTSGTRKRIHIWWDTSKDSWSPISFPIKSMQLPKRDMCKTSVNGTMTLYLESPKEYPQLMAYFTYNVTLLENTKDDEDRETEDHSLSSS